MESPTTMQPSPMQMPGPTEGLPVNSYYPEPPSDLTGGLPINLDSLRDGPPGSKPFYPYSTLIRFVLLLAFQTCTLLESQRVCGWWKGLF